MILWIINGHQIRGIQGNRYSGICYDRMNQMVFVGGGRKCSYDWKHPRGTLGGIQSYDLMKNKWLKLAYTWMDYQYRPNMWLSDSNPNVLFIASTNDDSMEYIDLRQNERHWKLIRSPIYGKYEDSLADMFGLKHFVSFSGSRLCVAKY